MCAKWGKGGRGIGKREFYILFWMCLYVFAWLMAADWQFMLLSCVRLVLCAAFAASKSMVINFFLLMTPLQWKWWHEAKIILVSDWLAWYCQRGCAWANIPAHTHTRSSLKCNHSPNDNHKKKTSLICMPCKNASFFNEARYNTMSSEFESCKKYCPIKFVSATNIGLIMKNTHGFFFLFLYFLTHKTAAFRRTIPHK